MLSSAQVVLEQVTRAEAGAPYAVTALHDTPATTRRRSLQNQRTARSTVGGDRMF